MKHLLALLVLCSSLRADTVGPRGPAGTGVFAARGLPRSFSETSNVRWKTPLPHTGLGTPLVVGGLVIVACDPGWQSDAPVLLAVDRATGAVRWQATVDNLDAPEWSDADREEGKRLRAEELAWARRFNEWSWRLKTDKDAVTAVAAAEGLEVTATGLRAPNTHPSAKRMQTLRRKGWFHYPGWGDWQDGRYWTGQTMPTPVSDGERIYICNNLNAVACFDLTGQRLWLRDCRAPVGQSLKTASPCLAGGVVVVFSRSSKSQATGYDSRTGKELWRQPDLPATSRYDYGSAPVLLDLAGTPAVFLSTGHVLKAADGTILGRLQHPLQAELKMDNHFGSCGHSIARGDRLWVNHSGYNDYGGLSSGVFAFQLGLDQGRLTSRLLWYHIGLGHFQNLVLDGDRLITHLGLVVDAHTGKVLAHRPPAGPDPGPILADGLILDLAVIGAGKRAGDDLPHGGCEVRLYDAATLVPVGRGRLAMDPPTGEKLRQRIACFRRDTMRWGGDSWGSNQSASSPVADGPDIFLRSNDNLYCLTAKDSPPSLTWEQLRPELVAAYKSPLPDERQWALRWWVQAHAAAARQLLEAHWPEAQQDTALLRAWVDLAAVLGWRHEPMLSALLATKAPNALPQLPAYFVAVDAARDPAVAERLRTLFPNDLTLLPTLSRHLPVEQFLAWLEPRATSNPSLALAVWRGLGPAALPSLQRFQANLSAEPVKRHRLNPRAIEVAIEAISKENKP